MSAPVKGGRILKPIKASLFLMGIAVKKSQTVQEVLRDLGQMCQSKIMNQEVSVPLPTHSPGVLPPVGLEEVLVSVL